MRNISLIETKGTVQYKLGFSPVVYELVMISEVDTEVFSSKAQDVNYENMQIVLDCTVQYVKHCLLLQNMTKVLSWMGYTFIFLVSCHEPLKCGYENNAIKPNQFFANTDPFPFPQYYKYFQLRNVSKHLKIHKICHHRVDCHRVTKSKS